MAIFDVGIKILFLITGIFFLAFSLICAAWAKPMHPEKRNMIGALVSALYSFWVFTGGFFILVLISLFWPYLSKLFPLFS